MWRIKWQEKKTSDFVKNKVTEIQGEKPESVVETAKRRKAEVLRTPDEKTNVDGQDADRRQSRGQQGKRKTKKTMGR